jgi:hypothetical protein
MEREEILKQLHDIIGGKKFTFSEAFIKGHVLEIGQGRPYSVVTKKYLYVSCFAVYKWDEEQQEYGTSIQKFPIFYNRMTGKYVDKVALNDMFTKDLQEVLDMVELALWWEKNIRLPEIQKQLDEVSKYAAIYDKKIHPHYAEKEELNSKKYEER